MPGDRGSQWRVILRCIALLRRLMRGDTPASELIAIIEQHDSDLVTADPEILQSRLEADISRLRKNLKCEINYIHPEKVYRFISLDTALLDLPEDAIQGLAFLQKTFSADETPHREQVMQLINQVLTLLPQERVKEVTRARGLLEIDLRSRDSKPIDAQILERVTLACNTHNEIEFVYRSPKQADEQPRTHRVEPMRCFLDPVRRHYLLEAYYLEVNGPFGRILKEGVRSYRLERMSDVHTLPKRFIPRQHRRTGVEIVYILRPKIARLRDVTEYIPNSIISYLPDDSARIEAISYNLFIDLRSLLHYGANCEVIGGDEARREMKALVAAMNQVYKQI